MTEQKKSPEISIIVPVYKVEKYLNECIDSILAQTDVYKRQPPSAPAAPRTSA